MTQPRLKRTRSSGRSSGGNGKTNGRASGGSGQSLPSGMDPFAPSDHMSKEERLLARKIRNRQSAALSRKRKTDLIEKLEDQVQQLQRENATLKAKLRRAEERRSPLNDRHVPVYPSAGAATTASAAELVDELCGSQFDFEGKGEGEDFSDFEAEGNSSEEEDKAHDEEDAALPTRKRTRSDAHHHNLRPTVQPASRFFGTTTKAPIKAPTVARHNLTMMDQSSNQPLPAE